MHTELGPFAIVPRWVRLGCKGQPWPLALYSLLADKADRREGGDNGWTIGREELAEELGTSASTIDRAVKHLETLGALTVTRNKKGKEWTWSRYLVHVLESQPVTCDDRVYSPVGQVSSPVATFPITPNQEPITTTPSACDPDFDAWYAAYPRKKCPPDARKAYASARKSGVSVEALRIGLALSVAEWRREKRPNEKIPYPATYIRKGEFIRESAPGSDMGAAQVGLVAEMLTWWGDAEADDARARFASAVRQACRSGMSHDEIRSKFEFIASTVGMIKL